MSKFWCVASSFDDKGRVTAAVTKVIVAKKKPENSFRSTRHKDIYFEWFESREAADEFVEEAKRA